jgi:hypothetical protein
MLEIRESQIEDIFATQLDEVKNILSLKENLSLINRQKRLPSGNIIDLLFMSARNLHLLELKAVQSNEIFCKQISGYREEIQYLQKNNELPNLPIKSYLVCPDFVDSHKKLCLDNNIMPIVFSPYELLKNYYFKVKSISKLIALKPSNHGLWNLNLLNKIIYKIDKGIKIEKLVSLTGLTKSTIGSYLRLSNELGLTEKKNKILLTDLGDKYVASKDLDKPYDYINEIQTEIIKEYITKNPFISPAIYGIYCAVETIFVLSKSFYPVPLKEASKFFRYLSGKHTEWAEKAATDAFIMYSNYSIDLGLLAKVNRDYYITPSGIRFILLLELNKSILYVNAI